jgi:hypothetical protein
MTGTVIKSPVFCFTENMFYEIKGPSCEPDLGKNT